MPLPITTPTVLDESILDDELKCECVHVEIPCSVHVTHRVISCATTTLWCANRYRKYIEKDTHLKCRRCRQPVADCWRVIPV